MLSTMQSLTGKQRKFIEHYLATLNGTEAARLAGYGGDYAALRVIGSENLAKPHIAQKVAQRLSDDVMQPLEVAARLSRIARGTMAHFIEEDGYIDLTTDAARDNLDLVKNIKRKNSIVTQIELYDGLKALSILAGIYERAGAAKLAEMAQIDTSTAQSSAIEQQDALTDEQRIKRIEELVNRAQARKEAIESDKATGAAKT